MSVLIIAIEPVSSVAAHGVEEQGRGDAVDDEAHVAVGRSAHRELGLEVVAGRDARQRLHGAHRIVGRHAAQLLQGAPSDSSTDRTRWASGAAAAETIDRLLVRARALGQRDRQLEPARRRDVDPPPHEDVADRRDRQSVGRPARRRESKSAVGVVRWRRAAQSIGRQRRSRASATGTSVRALVHHRSANTGRAPASRRCVRLSRQRARTRSATQQPGIRPSTRPVRSPSVPDRRRVARDRRRRSVVR